MTRLIPTNGVLHCTKALPAEHARKVSFQAGGRRSRTRQRVALCGSLLLAIFAATACTRHEVEIKPVEIKPIHITIDINVRVDRALDDYFGDLDEIQAEQ